MDREIVDLDLQASTFIMILVFSSDMLIKPVAPCPSLELCGRMVLLFTCSA